MGLQSMILANLKTEQAAVQEYREPIEQKTPCPDDSHCD
jgi:hypothetical protein